MLTAAAQRPESTEKSRKKLQKNVDRGEAVCYTSTYLSDERFLFVRIFSRRRAFFDPIQGGNARLLSRVNKIGGAERMAADARVKITLRCDECKQRNYNTVKNKKNTSDRLERSKYCPFCRKHTKHVETK